MHVVPLKSNLQALRLAIIGKAPNPSVVKGVVVVGTRPRRVDNQLPNASRRTNAIRMSSRMVQKLK
jgi:hypothetical protein